MGATRAHHHHPTATARAPSRDSMSKALPSTAWSLLHPCHVLDATWRPRTVRDSKRNKQLLCILSASRFSIRFSISYNARSAKDHNPLHSQPPGSPSSRTEAAVAGHQKNGWARVPQMDPDTQTSCGLHWRKTPRSQALPQSYTKVQAVFGWLSSFTLMETWITVNRSYLGKLSYVTNLK